MRYCIVNANCFHFGQCACIPSFAQVLGSTLLASWSSSYSTCIYMCLSSVYMYVIELHFIAVGGHSSWIQLWSPQASIRTSSKGTCTCTCIANSPMYQPIVKMLKWCHLLLHLTGNPCAGVPICVGSIPERVSPLSGELPVCVGVSPHISGEDSGGRVRHRHVTEGHTESDIHHTHQGELQVIVSSSYDVVGWRGGGVHVVSELRWSWQSMPLPCHITEWQMYTTPVTHHGELHCNCMFTSSYSIVFS